MCDDLITKQHVVGNRQLINDIDG